MESRIIVAGDYIRDKYILGGANINNYLNNDRSRYTRHNTTSSLTRHGGAGNVAANISEIVKDTLCEVCIAYNSQRPLELIRLEITPHNYLEYWNDSRPESYYATNNQSQNIRDLLDSNKHNTLVLSDYNKGSLTLEPNFELNTPDLIIVDSKHRSLHPKYLEHDCQKIWRCTGNEYNFEWAQQFDWVIKTDAQGALCFGPANIDKITRLDWEFKFVPHTKIVDTIGAGDTFTAAIAAYFSNNCTEPNMKTIGEACDFAIDCCQEVIQKRFCAITTKKI